MSNYFLDLRNLGLVFEYHSTTRIGKKEWLFTLIFKTEDKKATHIINLKLKTIEIFQN